MTCEFIQLPGGGTMIVCSRGRRSRPCAFCKATSSRLCDGPPPAKSRKKTCDKPLCATHATHDGPDRDLCPDCVATAARAAAPPLTTTVEVWTARLDPRHTDPDLLDITRGSRTEGEGLAFAPSMAILAPVLNARRRARGLPLDEQAKIEGEAWSAYVPAYLAEMLVSSVRPIPEGWERPVAEARARGVKPDVEAWKRLLARPRVCLACFCTGTRCHRFLLAKILGKLGATVRGELTLPVVPTSQLSLLGEASNG